MKSVWSDSCNFTKRETLTNNISTEVLVIGGGMAGLLTAYMLKKVGLKVVVIEAKEVASGVTKNTTAKITSQHDLIYYKLRKEFGEEKAQQYAAANELAIRKFKEIVDDKNIECEFEVKPAYVYSLDKTDNFTDEFETARKLGIDAELVNEVTLPFNVKCALKFNNQAQFNPLKFLKVISDELDIYENTKAVHIDVDNNLVITENNIEISAKNIVVATHYPFLNVPGYYFIRMHQERSYVLALENAMDVKGMYVDIAKDGISFRNYKDLLLLSSIDQRTGKNEEGGCYEQLRGIAKALFPNSKEKYYWSTQDCMTLDGIPYIGHYSASTPNIYVATGFNKWGMTSSMVSAMILSDMILGKENKYEEIFSPSRFDLSLSAKTLAQDTIETAKNFIAQRVDIPDEHIEHIQNGHGGIVTYKDEKVGVYKDEEGNVFMVTTKCSHLGCQLQWNADELTWDCPCHGSRFDYKGNWITGPATGNIKVD
ncbi:FAD-dependent oxidoreductase [Inconstantimicrobium mannanitabidum]|uniref:Oxidoreductase n=1 Tax=Inconstantimicrobium mannanitabidum TaxID=1604901 RepID=A0ACB5REL4_9CLOT|nr:FAD-dependent oxidoreductase [Clostridium sp. TW13]GKX67329.1 oxidoreductase [Clostridium sp. TW13]